MAKTVHGYDTAFAPQAPQTPNNTFLTTSTCVSVENNCNHIYDFKTTPINSHSNMRKDPANSKKNTNPTIKAAIVISGCLTSS
mmetsp:Transcript_6077/g.10911  ORF Transcript_6077/g.10911 Transcript_6077/m.10911 type:complete len:83 (-) Transcript_6077:375-623(-)